MKATQQLKDEHKGIKLMLDILEKISNMLDSGKAVDLSHLDQIIKFFVIFADKCHHAKEEDLLFPEMEKSGIPKEDGPIAVMLTEHTYGRNHIKGMMEAILQLKNRNANANKLFTENARSYIGLLRQHIDKEDNILYPIADRHLTENIQKKLFDNFEKIEIGRIGKGTHEKFHELLHRLKEIYLG